MIAPASGKFQPNKSVPYAVLPHKSRDNTDAFGSPGIYGYHGNPHYNNFGQSGVSGNLVCFEQFRNVDGSMSSNLVGFHNQPTDQLMTNINNAGKLFYIYFKLFTNIFI